MRYLADKVDDIELVLFESKELANIPSTDVVGELNSLAQDNDLTYTIHLPIDIHTGHAEEAERRKSVEKCLAIIDRMAPLNPAGYLLHLDGDQRGGVPSEDLPRWQANHRSSIGELIAHMPEDLLCVETLDYPYELVIDIVTDLGTAICLDIGHLLLYGYDVDAHLQTYLSRTRVIHLHGIEKGRDHKAISHLDTHFLKSLWDYLTEDKRYGNVVTLEVFGEKAFGESIDTLQKL